MTSGTVTASDGTTVTIDGKGTFSPSNYGVKVADFKALLSARITRFTSDPTLKAAHTNALATVNSGATSVSIPCVPAGTLSPQPIITLEKQP